jgi:transcription antitermination factor NusG
MPILRDEPLFYPPDLWSGEPLGVDPGRRWWCLYTKPRQERSTARHLHTRQIAYYLPQITQERRTPSGRAIRSVIPLFPSYVFLFGDEAQRVEALRCNHLANVFEVLTQQELADDLRQIHRLLSSGMSIVREPTHPVGSRVRITSGPLAGMDGLVIRRGKSDRFAAVIRFLASGATVELCDWQVEEIGRVD